VNDPRNSSSSLVRTEAPVSQRRGSELTLSVTRRPSSLLTTPDRYQPSRHRPQTQEKRQDWKALRMLSAILLAFLVTWSPYNLFTVIQTFCTSCINPSLYAMGTSNLYTSFAVQSSVHERSSSSLMNPKYFHHVNA